MDKQSIYVPETTYEALYRDAEMFEVFKADGRTINKNKFLNKVLLGYSNIYEAECNAMLEIVVKELEGIINNHKDRREAARKIVQAISSPIPADKRGLGFKRLSLKPVKDTEGIFWSLYGNGNQSRYLCGMFASYCAKPSWERERIVFHDTVEILAVACKARNALSFRTIWDPNTIHRVIPYALAAGKDGQHNYLLCYEEQNATRPALAYRLSRIDSLCVGAPAKSIPADVERHLQQMLKTDPQYAINDDAEARVNLTTTGEIAFRRIYSGRPIVTRIEQSRDDSVYCFNCSLDQLFIYFRRFGPKEAEVLSPASLRQRIIDFHEGALSMYQAN